MKLVSGPLIVTPWRAEPGEPAAAGCTTCRSWFPVAAGLQGKVTQCPRCGQLIALTEFTLEGDWRRIARAWTSLLPGSTA